MIVFVTVGSMLPFDRLIEAMDDWAARHPAVRLLAQIGDGTYEPSHMPWTRMVSNSEFVANVKRADLIVAHAGTGSVFTAMEFAKPIVLVPRYADAREHTTDHQVHTANWLRSRSGIVICERGDNLDARIDEALARGTDSASFSPAAPASFLERIRAAVTA